MLSRFKKILRLAFPKEQEKLVSALLKNESALDIDLKIKIYNLLLALRKDAKRPFGMLIVLGWQKQWNKKYVGFPDITQNIFRNNKISLRSDSYNDIAQIVKKTMDFDGAILINAKGDFIASGVYLTDIKPQEIAKILHQSTAVDLSTSFGFKRKVHMRHLAGIATSYILKETTVFVLSEEDGSLRIFEEGRIVWSTIGSEIVP